MQAVAPGRRVLVHARGRPRGRWLPSRAADGLQQRATERRQAHRLSGGCTRRRFPAARSRARYRRPTQQRRRCGPWRDGVEAACVHDGARCSRWHVPPGQSRARCGQVALTRLSEKWESAERCPADVSCILKAASATAHPVRRCRTSGASARTACTTAARKPLRIRTWPVDPVAEDPACQESASGPDSTLEPRSSIPGRPLGGR